MGARIWGRHGGELAPLAIQGRPLKAISYDSPIASAQVKSALLLAGLYADGVTTIREPYQSRDHSERMLAYFGADIRTFAGGVSVEGQPQLEGREVFVPGDISSAAFFMVAALITPHSELLIRNVGLNPTRSGVIDILQQMGGYVQVLNKRELSGEAVADILIKSSTLKGIEIGGAVVPRAIDEFPVISVAATFAEGNTIIRDARELRVKETDRIAAMTTELGKLGGLVEARDDGMLITGVEQLNGGSVTSQGDHRVAMSLVVAALRAASPVTIDDTGCVGTSFPNFWDLLKNVKT
jgi:3-phosphoshikimate 1-carboxyvinyltransferase